MEDNFIMPKVFNELFESGSIDPSRVIDVREPQEWDYYHLEGTSHMPMNTLPQRVGELPPDQTLYIVCAHGVRSSMVCDYLIRSGFDHVVNVEGGMAAVSHYRGFQYD